MKITTQRYQLAALVSLFALCLFFQAASPLMAAEKQTPKHTAAAKDLSSQLIGTWVLESASNPGTPPGIGSRLKFFTGTHWFVIQPDPSTGGIVFQHGGPYELKGNTMSEHIDFAGELTKALIGRTGEFTIEVDGNTYKQIDPNGIFNETWKRVE